MTLYAILYLLINETPEVLYINFAQLPIFYKEIQQEKHQRIYKRYTLHYILESMTVKY